MNKQQYIHYIKNYNSLNESDEPILKKLIEQFPYCQTTQLLYTKLLHNINHIMFQEQLKKTAIYVIDRKALYRLINSNEITNNNFSQEHENSQKLTSTNQNESFISNTENNISIVEKDETNNNSFDNQHTGNNPIVYADSLTIEDAKDTTANKETFLSNEDTPIQEEIISIINTEETITDTSQTKTEENKQEPNIEELETDKVSIQLNNQKENNSEQEIIKNEEQQNIKIELVGENINLSNIHEEDANEIDINKDDYKHIESISNEELSKLNEIFLSLYPQEKEQNKELITPLIQQDNNNTNTLQNTFDKETTQQKTPTPTKDNHTENKNQQKLEKYRIIDKFIKTKPKITPKKEFFSPIDKAKESVIDKEEIVSETLAMIYINQKNYQKAISIYEKLIVLNPKKSIYFANEIKKLKDLLNS